MKLYLKNHWRTFSRTPFGCLLRLFITRMFHGGDEPGADELDFGIGVIVIMLAMPGILVSLLMFEKYGSLIRYLRGNLIFDPYTATVPDEYFFIVVSLTVTGAAALWRWDALFLDRRDYSNLVPLPVSLRAVFFANLSAILGRRRALDGRSTGQAVPQSLSRRSFPPRHRTFRAHRQQFHRSLSPSATPNPRRAQNCIASTRLLLGFGANRLASRRRFLRRKCE